MSLQPSYEYKVEDLNEDNLDVLEKKLNLLGQDAWELISLDSDGIGIFKRPKLYFITPNPSPCIEIETTIHN